MCVFIVVVGRNLNLAFYFFNEMIKCFEFLIHKFRTEQLGNLYF